MTPTLSTQRAPWALRLTVLELRKLVVTRSTRTLLIVMAAIGVSLSGGVELLAVLGAHSSTVDFSAGLIVLTAPIALGIPLIGVLVFTSDWQQREVMTMFLLEPRRHRIFWAKLIATVVTGLLVVLATVVACFALTGLIATFTPAAFDLGDDLIGPVTSVLSFTFVGTLLGAAIGAATLNSPLGIVIVLLQSAVVDGLLGFIPNGIGGWLRSSALAELLYGEGSAAHAATSFVLWLAIPFAIGYLRNQQREPR